MNHLLKTEQKHFVALWAGLKTFELRHNDRNYQVGDTLELKELRDPNKGGLLASFAIFTERAIFALVTHILRGGESLGFAPGDRALRDDCVILSLKITGWRNGEITYSSVPVERSANPVTAWAEKYSTPAQDMPPLGFVMPPYMESVLPQYEKRTEDGTARKLAREINAFIFSKSKPIAEVATHGVLTSFEYYEGELLPEVLKIAQRYLPATTEEFGHDIGMVAAARPSESVSKFMQMINDEIMGRPRPASDRTYTFARYKGGAYEGDSSVQAHCENCAHMELLAMMPGRSFARKTC